MRWPSRAAGLCVLLAGSSGVEALRLHSLKVALPHDPGGLVGDVVARVLHSGFGFTGATLILLTLCAMTLSLFTGISWLAVMDRIGEPYVTSRRRRRSS